MTFWSHFCYTYLIFWLDINNIYHIFIFDQMNKLLLNARKNLINNLQFNFGVVSNEHLSKDA